MNLNLRDILHTLKHQRPSNVPQERMLGLLVFLIFVSERVISAIERPNVILMFIDDTGWGDYGFNDPKRTDSPNLDALASRGMIFSDFHAGASVCTPSRASLLTGRLGIRTGVISNFSPFSEHGSFVSCEY